MQLFHTNHLYFMRNIRNLFLLMCKNHSFVHNKNSFLTFLHLVSMLIVIKYMLWFWFCARKLCVKFMLNKCAPSKIWAVLKSQTILPAQLSKPFDEKSHDPGQIVLKLSPVQCVVCAQKSRDRAAPSYLKKGGARFARLPRTKSGPALFLFFDRLAAPSAARWGARLRASCARDKSRFAKQTCDL